MNNTRSTCITLTLLLVAASLAFAGCSAFRTEGATPTAGTGTSDGASPGGSATSNETSSNSLLKVKGAEPSLTATQAEALDVQLRAVEKELELLAVPGDPVGPELGMSLE